MTLEVVPDRIYGNKLSFIIDGKEYNTDLTSYLLEPGEADSKKRTFAEVAKGAGVKWTMKLSALQSTTTASLWRAIWDKSGKEVDYVIAPFGNDTPTEAQPHFKGKVKIGRKPSLGGDAGEEEFTFETEWACTGEPQLVTTSGTYTPPADAGTGV